MKVINIHALLNFFLNVVIFSLIIKLFYIKEIILEIGEKKNSFKINIVIFTQFFSLLNVNFHVIINQTNDL